MDWKLWFADGSTFSSDDGTWFDAPARGVLALVSPDEIVGREVDSGDFYIWWPHGSKPWAVDAWGLMDFLLTLGILDPKDRVTDVSFVTLAENGVKLGRSVDNSRYREVRSLAAADPDFPAKSGRFPRERS